MFNVGGGRRRSVSLAELTDAVPGPQPARRIAIDADRRDARRRRALLHHRQHRGDRGHRLGAAAHASTRCSTTCSRGCGRIAHALEPILGGCGAGADRRSRDVLMAVAIITGSAGLIGSEAALFFAAQGLRRRRHRQRHARATSSAPTAAPRWHREPAASATCRGYRHVDADIRDEAAMDAAVRAATARDIALVIHTAAQPSHDWAAREPLTDFTVNANGTLILLEATRAALPRRGRSSSPAPTRSTATRRTGCRWSSRRRAGRSTPTHPFSRARHRRVDEHRRVACTACSAPRRWPPT